MIRVVQRIIIVVGYLVSSSLVVKVILGPYFLIINHFKDFFGGHHRLNYCCCCRNDYGSLFLGLLGFVAYLWRIFWKIIEMKRRKKMRMKKMKRKIIFGWIGIDYRHHLLSYRNLNYRHSFLIKRIRMF